MAHAGNSGYSPVHFEISIPRAFYNSSVYLTGDLPELGAWQPNAIPLTRHNDKWIANVIVPNNAWGEFKITLGDWQHSEVGAKGEEISNHRVYFTESSHVLVKVANFRIIPLHKPAVSASSRIQYHHEFFSSSFQNSRSLAVYVPRAYADKPFERFPVVYALDGNNLFDKATSTYGDEWEIDETLDQLMWSQKLPPFIVVGIYNTNKRGDEYLFSKDPKLKIGGGAKEYMDFILNEVKPFIDETYRTKPDRQHTALLGSSFGGHFALFAAKEYGHVFSRFGSLSTAYWFNNYCLFDLLKKPFFIRPSRVWIDMGENEGMSSPLFNNGVNDLKFATDLLLAQGLKSGDTLQSYVQAGGLHNEKSWAKRIELVLRFLFPTGS